MLSTRQKWIWTGGLGLLFFILIALNVRFGTGMDRLDTEINAWLDGRRTAPLNTLMLAITAMGDSLFLTFVGVVTVIAVFASGARRIAAGLAAAFIGTPLLVTSLKALIARARPTVDLYGGIEAFSFPSGHTTNSALIYGAIALVTFIHARRLPGRLISAAFAVLPLAIAASRIYLGAHWPSDTAAGLCLAAACLSCLAIYVLGESHDEHPSRAVPIGLFAITAAFPLYLIATLPNARDLYTALHG